jgi:5-oxoprolinase (ATP-hydrolysing)
MSSRREWGNSSLAFFGKNDGGDFIGRRVIFPCGLNGAGAGSLGKNYVVRENGTVEALGSTAVVDMDGGDVFVIETPGGGGFGV